MSSEKLENLLGIQAEAFDRVCGEVESEWYDNWPEIIDRISTECDADKINVAYALAKVLLNYVEGELGRDPILFATALTENLAEIQNESKALDSVRDALQRILDSRS